uniref:Uncharacterized protein n=1 Tax=Anguilla anguilla TaxID=7936 RepID=A0A0E9P7U7_ANGAN
MGSVLFYAHFQLLVIGVSFEACRT